MNALLVVLGAVIGAPARYVVDVYLQSRHRTAFPWGTFTVNVIGATVLGSVAGALSVGRGPTWLMTAVGTGFCGAFTTFSAFSAETVRLIDAGRTMTALTNVVASVLVGFAGCAAAFSVAARLLP